MRCVSLAFLASLALASAALPARAEDPPAKTPAQTLAEELDAAKAAKDEAKWAEGLKRIAALYPNATEADKSLLMQAAGAGLKAKSDTVQIAALDAMVGSKDGDAAWKAGLRSELPDEKEETAKTFAFRAIAAVKDLHPDAAIQPLLTLLRKAKDPKVAAKSMEALGSYERSKQRAMVLEELVKVIRGAMPSRSATKRSAATPKWTEMDPLVVPTLNALTGHTISDLGTWLKFIDEDGKKKPETLFKNKL